MLRRPLREGVGRNHHHLLALAGLPAVALYARAWVEMIISKPLLLLGIGRPLREGVGRNGNINHTHIPLKCRPLREGVGRNDPPELSEFIVPVALYARAWVEINDFEERPTSQQSPSTRGRG